MESLTRLKIQRDELDEKIRLLERNDSEKIRDLLKDEFDRVSECESYTDGRGRKVIRVEAYQHRSDFSTIRDQLWEYGYVIGSIRKESGTFWRVWFYHKP